MSVSDMYVVKQVAIMCKWTTQCWLWGRHVSGEYILIVSTVI